MAMRFKEDSRLLYEFRTKDEVYVLNNLVSQIQEALPKFTEIENAYIDRGRVYVFPKTTSRTKKVSAIRLKIGKENIEICRSRAKIVDGDNGPEVDKETFERKRGVMKGKYEFPYYVWEGSREDIGEGIAKLESFMEETGW